MHALQPIARLAVTLFAVCTCATAQTPPASPLASATQPTPQSFEVASIRLVEPHSKEDMQKGIGLAAFNSWPANRVFAHYMSLSNLIAVAFKTDENRILGAPEWLTTQLYSIDARVEGDRQLTADEMRPLVQNLLAQRFHLAVHPESKLVSGYDLVLAKGGSKLQPSEQGAKQFFYILSNGIQGRGATMSTLASMLERPAGRPVVDKTGLTGSCDIKLSYAPANDANSNLPDIFTALQEQLGLKLEPQKVPVDFLVIDHVDRVPTDN